MKVVIYTVDLFPGRERLMPWRTILELGQYLLTKDIEVEILSVSKERKNNSYTYGNICITPINNSLPEIVNYVNQNDFDVFLLQVKWRDGLKNLNVLSKLNCKKIAYFDGGVYRLRNAVKLFISAGFRLARPYLLEALTPKYLIIRKLKNNGFSQIVTLSSLTADLAISNGFKATTTIYPGNDTATPIKEHRQPEEKYFLYAGSPAPARGSLQLLKAFDKFADSSHDAKLVLLMRTDAGSDFTLFEKELNNLKNRTRIELICQNLAHSELKRFFSGARSVILPFLVIPSEIPLTFFEVLSTGTPVITFPNGGTTDYLRSSLAISNKMTTSSLANTMKRLWNDDALYQKLSFNAISIMKKHPTWQKTGEDWLKVINHS